MAKEKLSNITEELENRFLTYALSTIVSRSLPDVRDGLKPIHRRILYAMNGIGVNAETKHVKSAKIIGEVLGKYHPHGDASTYESMARMAQDFSMRYPLVDGKGNFGSMDGDPPAAYRYTEGRLTPITSSLLADLKKETIDFKLVYDKTQRTKYEMPPENNGVTPTEWIIDNKQPLLLEENVVEGLQALGVTLPGEIIQSYLGVPMLRGRDVIGVLAVQSYTTPRAFSGHELDLLSAVANQASTAIDNARRFQATQAQAKREQLLREINAKVHSSADADSVLRTAVKEISNALGRQATIEIGGISTKIEKKLPQKSETPSISDNEETIQPETPKPTGHDDTAQLKLDHHDDPDTSD